jgi:hypothetical protein
MGAENAKRLTEQVSDRQMCTSQVTSAAKLSSMAELIP